MLYERKTALQMMQGGFYVEIIKKSFVFCLVYQKTAHYAFPYFYALLLKEYLKQEDS